MSTELKPCPFCGAEPEVFDKPILPGVENQNMDIRCNTPGCYLEGGADWWTMSEEQITKMWNNRK